MENVTKDTSTKSRYSFLDPIRTAASYEPAMPGSSQAIVHLNAYMEETLLPDNADVIGVCHKFQACEPLKKIALKYLNVPASSVPAERVNSTAGNTITEKRASLTPVMEEKFLIFFR